MLNPSTLVRTCRFQSTTFAVAVWRNNVLNYYAVRSTTGVLVTSLLIMLRRSRGSRTYSLSLCVFQFRTLSRVEPDLVS